MLLLAFVLEFFAYVSSYHFYLDFVSLMTLSLQHYSLHWRIWDVFFLLCSLGKKKCWFKAGLYFSGITEVEEKGYGWKNDTPERCMQTTRPGCWLSSCATVASHSAAAANGVSARPARALCYRLPFHGDGAPLLGAAGCACVALPVTAGQENCLHAPAGRGDGVCAVQRSKPKWVQVIDQLRNSTR